MLYIFWILGMLNSEHCILQCNWTIFIICPLVTLSPSNYFPLMAFWHVLVLCCLGIFHLQACKINSPHWLITNVTKTLWGISTIFYRKFSTKKLENDLFHLRILISMGRLTSSTSLMGRILLINWIDERHWTYLWTYDTAWCVI